MRSTKSWIFPILLALGSGCVGPTASHDGAVLDDYKVCSFQYEDGSTVRCQDEALWLEPQSELPAPADGWFCQVGVDSSEVRMDWMVHPVEGRYGIGYEVLNPALEQFTGVVAVNAGSPGSVSVWESQGQRGFVEVPAAEAGADTSVSFFHVEHRSDHPALRDASARLLWSHEPTGREADEYAVYSIDAEGGPFFFSPMRPHPLFPDELGLGPAHFEGSDFNLILEYAGIEGWLYQLRSPTTFQTSCATA